MGMLFMEAAQPSKQGFAIPPTVFATAFISYSCLDPSAVSAWLCDTEHFFSRVPFFSKIVHFLTIWSAPIVF